MTKDEYWIWGTNATAPRLLHSMIRVFDLDRSLRFYCGLLGMQEISRVDVEAGRFTIVFVNFSDDFESGAIELTHNWDAKEEYTHGNGYGHVAIGVPDIVETCRKLREAGANVTDPRSLLPGAPALAFVKDPDGYAIELIQTARE